MIRRELNLRSAMTSGSDMAGSIVRWLSPAHEIHDLDLVPFVDPRVGVGGPLDDDEVALDGDAAGIDVEAREQIRDSNRAGVEDVRIAVERDRQSLPQHSVAGERGRDAERLGERPQP